MEGVEMADPDEDFDRILVLRTPTHDGSTTYEGPTSIDKFKQFIGSLESLNEQNIENEAQEDDESSQETVTEIVSEGNSNNEWTIQQYDNSYKGRVQYLYKSCFPDLAGSLIIGWMKRDITLICVNQRHLIGALTCKYIKYKGVKYIDLILMGINKGYQGKGFGRSMMMELCKADTKILTWADDGAVGFYEKLGFVRYYAPVHHEKLLDYFTLSTLMGRGFSSGDCKKLTLNKI